MVGRRRGDGRARAGRAPGGSRAFFPGDGVWRDIGLVVYRASISAWRASSRSRACCISKGPARPGDRVFADPDIGRA
eukprot:11215012-Lingulodinium_polyedra.AAC.1